MKLRFSLVLIGVVIVAGFLLVAAKSRHTTISQQKDPAGTIDGSVNPSAIPDHVAYEALFKTLLPDPVNHFEEGAVSAKLAQIGVSETDGIGLKIVASDFAVRQRALDAQVAAMRSQNLPPEDPSLLAQLRDIQKQKEAMIGEMRNRIGQKLSAAGTEKVNQYVAEYVKRRIKIVPPSHHR